MPGIKRLASFSSAVDAAYRTDAWRHNEDLKMKHKYNVYMGKLASLGISQAALNNPTTFQHVNTMLFLSQRNGKIENCIQERVILTDSSRLRSCWNLMLFICLIYTGIGLPYRLAFVEFRIAYDVPSIKDFWYYLEFVIDVCFWIDLFLCFFCSYRDSKDKEIIDFRMICKRYLVTFFPINLVACTPTEVFGLLIAVFSERSGGRTSAHQTIRLTRLQRISRLARLIRLVRMTKLVSFSMSSSAMQYIQTLRGIRVMNFMAGLLWVVHLTACFWYICASLHENPDETWVGRRVIGNIPLYEQPAVEQWLHSMYFVMTVFTTVGFGDISALTIGEISFIIVIMMIGAVVNGIVLSEVINLITSADQKCKQINEQKELVLDFAEHTNLSDRHTRMLTDWIKQGKARNHAYNRERMRDLITGLALPRSLTEKLPEAVFRGKLFRNKFITMSSVTVHRGSAIPHRFPLLVALAATPRSFDPEEVVYHTCDHAWNLYIVLSGVFAALARPLVGGGLIEIPPVYGVGRDLNNTDPTHGESVSILDPPNAIAHRFYCEGNYFGDVELVLPGSIPRRTTIRCESEDGGKLLVLHKRDIFTLTKEFPQAARAWRCIAVRREDQRLALHKNFRCQGGYMDVAATMIQQFWRVAKEKWQSESSDELELSTPKRTVTEMLSGVIAARNRRVKSLVDTSIPPYAKKLFGDMDSVREEVANLRSDMLRLNSKVDLLVSALGLAPNRVSISSEVSVQTLDSQKNGICHGVSKEQL